jgi:hypothetical protein
VRYGAFTWRLAMTHYTSSWRAFLMLIRFSSVWFQLWHLYRCICLQICFVCSSRPLIHKSRITLLLILRSWTCDGSGLPYAVQLCLPHCHIVTRLFLGATIFAVPCQSRVLKPACCWLWVAKEELNTDDEGTRPVRRTRRSTRLSHD